MNIAIVDDEENQLTDISQKVKSYLQKRDISFQVFIYRSGEELLSTNQSFDLIFLDIQMDGITGMETAKQLRVKGIKSFIVFVTISKEYVYEAFEVEASDYLLKPINDIRFKNMMDRISKRLKAKNKNLIISSKGHAFKSILLSDILYCEAVNHKIHINTKTTVFKNSFKIAELEAKLDERFFKCHRSYLINLEYVCGYEEGLALLTNGEKIPVSRLRMKEFSKKMLLYMKEGGL